MIPRVQLVRCIVHGTSCCWVQLDGTHISPKACRCGDADEAIYCPIDGHSLRYITRHPEFVEDQP